MKTIKNECEENFTAVIFLVYPTVQFSNSFHDNQIELYALKDSLTTESLIDYNPFFMVFQVKQQVNNY
jgi:hypothetical protein